MTVLEAIPIRAPGEPIPAAPNLKHRLDGRRFGKLVVTGRSIGRGGRSTWWAVMCDCGVETVARSEALLGTFTSCGCDRRGKRVAAGRLNARTHGLTGTRVFRIWKCMRQRCYYKAGNRYYRYGGRGITVCPEWRDDPEAFATWSMANGYGDHLSIDRIDNDGDYSPRNCQWATREQQALNRRARSAVGWPLVERILQTGLRFVPKP